MTQLASAFSRRADSYAPKQPGPYSIRRAIVAYGLQQLATNCRRAALQFETEREHMLDVAAIAEARP